VNAGLQPGPLRVRAVGPDDFAGWLPLWQGYNAFYGRDGDSALAEDVTNTTWARFLDPAEPVHALVAAQGDELVGLAHFLYHRSTTRIEPTCYLQDLFTLQSARGQGVGRALIEGVFAAARAARVERVYWQTQSGNARARRLYDQVATYLGFITYSREL
jgi:GNAT superfamily N-acetyltransferase